MLSFSYYILIEMEKKVYHVRKIVPIRSNARVEILVLVEKEYFFVEKEKNKYLLLPSFHYFVLVSFLYRL